MKKDDLLVTEYRTLNSAYEYSPANLAAAKEGAQKQADITGKVLVIVQVLEVITPTQAGGSGE